jgi:hypothetical protein
MTNFSHEKRRSKRRLQGFLGKKSAETALSSGAPFSAKATVKKSLCFGH